MERHYEFDTRLATFRASILDALILHLDRMAVEAIDDEGHKVVGDQASMYLLPSLHCLAGQGQVEVDGRTWSYFRWHEVGVEMVEELGETAGQHDLVAEVPETLKGTSDDLLEFL